MDARSPDQAQMLALLNADDPESIREGARLAGSSKDERAIPLLVRHAASSNIGVQEAVDRALRKIGGPAMVHAVIPLLRSDEPPVRNLAMDLLRAQGHTDLEALHALLLDEDPDVRIFAADILGSVGSAQAVSPLCRALSQDPEVNVRYQAAVSLGALAFPEAVPALNKALHDEEWVQFSVIEALTKIRAESSVQALLGALEKASDLVASTIVDALGEMGNIKAVPLLLRRLDASPSPLCNKIVRAVVSIMGERSLSLLGAKDCERLRGYLPNAVEDEDPAIQDAAVRGFAALGGEGATSNILKLVPQIDVEKDADRLMNIIDALVRVGHTPELDQAVRVCDDLTMQVATEALLRINPEAAVPLLMDVFWERSRDVQRQLVLELASRAGRDRQQFFLDVLERHSDGNVLRGALMFLGRKGDPEAVQEHVIPFLSHKYDDVKETALEACIALRTPLILQHLRDITRHHDPAQRMMGVYAFGFMNKEDFLEEFKDALNDESPDVRKVSIEALGRDCPIPEEYIALIEQKLDDDNREVRMAVVDTLGSCSDSRMHTYLMHGLDDPDPWVRVRCAERLGQRKDRRASERLISMLEDSNHLIVIKSIEALGMIGGETAFRALLPLLEHPDRDLRAAAEEALDAVHRQAGE